MIRKEREEEEAREGRNEERRKWDVGDVRVSGVSLRRSGMAHAAVCWKRRFRSLSIMQ